ncbi:MAG TPA: VWA domain-containing protein [Kofleriaceae bacterium]|nr:VWA domain-containing protein [Kofleriaceae bacterium]
MILPGGVELRDPWFLLVCALAVPIVVLGLRRTGHVTFSSLAILPRHQSLRARLGWLPAALWALAAIAMGLAAAGPRIPDRNTPIHRRGIAIMMVIDTSGSMRALDLSLPDHERTRLDAVKEVMSDFVTGAGDLSGRPNDAVGIVTFARYAETRSPLTLDHDRLVTIAGGLEIVTQRSEDGTAIGDGLGLAVLRLNKTKADSKVAILLTDGINNAGEMTPTKAAQLAAKLGIKVYAIGAGTTGIAPIRVQDPFTGRTVLRPTRVQIDETTLRAIAKATGGRYFRATDAKALRRIYESIDKLERTELEGTRYRTYRNLYPHLLLLGLVLACAGWILSSSWLRRLP